MSQSNLFPPGQIRPAAAITFHLTRNTVADPQQTLAHRLTGRLGLVPGSLGSQVEELRPARMADRILSFIDSRLQQELANGGESKRLRRRFEKSVKAVDKGFVEARRILDRMGQLSGQAVVDIDETQELIRSGLREVAYRLLPDEPVPASLFGVSA